MSVIEALMILYAKEVTSGDRIHSAVYKLTSGSVSSGLNSEQLLLLWVSHVMASLKRRIDHDLTINELVDEKGKKLRTPDIPAPIQDITSLCDGVCLAYLIAFYCPKILPWYQIRISYLPTVEDSLHNVLLINNFSERHLPYSVFHMMAEDVTYMRGNMKQNLVVLLADMFNLFEIHPAPCVDYPECEKSTVVRSPSSNNVYRHHTPPKEVFYGTSNNSNNTNSSSNNGNMEADSEFVVHRSKGVPTLSTMHDPLIPAKLRQSKEKSNNDTKADERGDKAAGRPSNWDDRKTSYAGRRSRRNSFSEDSQLTIENFGGSQDQLNMIGTFDRRSQDRERKISNTSIEPTLPARSSIADARGTLVIGYESDGEKEDKESEKPHLKRQNSNTSSSNSSGVHHIVEEKRKMSSFASLAPAPTTTWQQQSVNAHQMNEMRDTNQPFVDDSKLSSVRLKLEEKRRHIEKEKRRLESQMSKQLQKVGKAAFLQAINKRDVTMEQPQWSKKLPDYEHNNNISLEQYQQSIAVMNSDLHDIQEDIQKLAEQQNQIQVQTMQAQQLLQAQQIANILTQQYGSQQNITGMYHPIQQQQYNSTPQLPIQKPIHHQYINDQGQYVNQKIQSRENSRIIEDQYSSPSQYLNHEQQKHIAKYVQETNNFRDQFEPQQPQFFLHGETPSAQVVSTPPSQVSTPPVPARRTWSQKAPPEMSTWSQQQQIQQQQQSQQINMNKYDTWKSPSNQQQQTQPQIQIQQQLQQTPPQQPVKSQNSGFVLHKQNGRESEAQRLFPVVHATPPKPNQSRIPDEMMMAPQSISFLGDEEDIDEGDNYQSPIPRNNGSSIKKSFDKIDEFEASFGKLNITSGSRTYRIPSPTTRQGIADSSYKSIESQNENENEKGFYISFDNDKQPKRPKPPLRTKKSPKKSSEDYDNSDNFVDTQEIASKKVFDLHHTEKKPTMESIKSNNNNYSIHEQQSYQPRISTPKEHQAIVIADDKNFDMSIDEMERKKEKIMLLSLQRRQQQEEAKARKEIEAMQRREREQEKEDEKSRKKDEQMARRAQILEQHRLKKAIEEAEREGKTLDRHTTEMLMKQQQHQQSMAAPQPKMRMNKPQRPRPKTIHVETNTSLDISGSGKKGSNSNLTGIGLSNTIRRDYYRGSQDSLSIKDSDSGLGRTTPPRRRAASPGMGSGSSSRHLPSPSGPGSLPHPSLMSKRRVIGYDDGASDISSTQSSIFGDYNGNNLILSCIFSFFV
ncbi:hypothetical protein ACKWTF_010065 [Chironomus riparius]